MGSIPELLQRTGDGLIAIDGWQRVVFWNRAATSLLGLAEDEAIGRRCYEVLDCRDDQGQAVCARDCSIFSSMRRGDELESREIVIRRDDGQRLRFSFSFIALDDGPDPTKALFLLRPCAPDGITKPTAERSPAPEAAAMVVRCFGSFEVSVGGVRLSGPPLSRNKAGRALRLLVHRRGQRVPRDELAEVLWPDTTPDAARASLKVLIHSLRRALEPELGPRQNSRFIDYESDSYLFITSSDIRVDVDAFLANAAEGQRQEGRGTASEAQARYQEAVDLYQGDYLTEDQYEDWCAGERQRLLELYLSVLMSLAAVHARQRNYAAAADCCWRAVARDGCRESSYRLLMDYLWRDGRPHEALRVYDRCRTVLERDLGLPPLPETTDLYRRIVAEIG